MLCPVVGWAKKECPVSMYCLVYRVRPCMRLLWILCNAVSMYCRMQCTVCVLWILGSPVSMYSRASERVSVLCLCVPWSRAPSMRSASH